VPENARGKIAQIDIPENRIRIFCKGSNGTRAVILEVVSMSIMSLGDNELDPLDRPLWGAAAIGFEANALDENGSTNSRTFYVCNLLVEKGVVDKVGGRFVSTRRRLRSFFGGPVATA
jgi:hypothetical protein